MIYFENETSISFDFDIENTITNVINYCVDYMICPFDFEVNVLLTDNENIHQINLETRNIDKPTDVLTFPFIEFTECGNFTEIENNIEYFNPDTGCLMLGDMVISLEKVLSQAKEYGHTSHRELAFLTAHSMLHLFGYDHILDEDAKIMEKHQKEIMNALRINR